MVQSKLQRQAQLENYALFQLKGMTSNLVHLLRVPGLDTLKICELEHAILAVRGQIKQMQYQRKKEKVSYEPHN